MFDALQGLDIQPISFRDKTVLDDKFRVLLPPKVKARLRADFVVARGFYGGLIAVPAVVWKVISDEVRRAPLLHPDRIYFSSQFLGASEDDINADGSGRFVIPKGLRADANLTEKGTSVMLNGADFWLEIWNAADFDRFSEDPQGFGGARFDRLLKAYQGLSAAARGGLA